MKATLEFDLDYRDEKDGNDRESLERAIHADDTYFVLWDFLHNYGRHADYTEAEENLLVSIKDHLRAELSARGVAMD